MTRARPGRLIFLIGITLVGAVLLAIAAVWQSRETQRRAAGSPAPAWRSADRSVTYLEAQIRAFAPSDSAGWRRAVACLQALDLLPSGTSDPARARMTRTMNSGHAFDAEISVTRRTAAPQLELEFELTRPGQAQLRLRLDVRAGTIAAVRQADAASSSWQPWNGAPELPLSLGDLPVAEVLALAHAFGSGRLRPVGAVETLGAQPQLVLETMDFESAPGTEPAAGDPTNDTAGARAWAYVDAATCALRSVRVFDSKGFVVRMYEDLGWVESGARMRLSQLRVTSMPNNSHTVFRHLKPQPPSYSNRTDNP